MGQTGPVQAENYAYGVNMPRIKTARIYMCSKWKYILENIESIVLADFHRYSYGVQLSHMAVLITGKLVKRHSDDTSVC